MKRNVTSGGTESGVCPIRDRRDGADENARRDVRVGWKAGTRKEGRDNSTSREAGASVRFVRCVEGVMIDVVGGHKTAVKPDGSDQ